MKRIGRLAIVLAAAISLGSGVSYLLSKFGF
jgi:hypothetical protein